MGNSGVEATTTAMLPFIATLYLFPTLIVAQLDTRSFDGTFDECLTSKTDAGNEDSDGELGAPCRFPFTLQGETYWACTYDYGHLTGYKPWCATKTDRSGNYIQGNWGVCDDTFNCPIPPRRCGEPISTRNRLPSNGEREDDLDIKQLPWMVALGSYQEEDAIEVNPRTQTRFASFEDGEAGPCDHVGEGFTLLDGKCKKWTHQCGASLITNKHILSAAHCFDGQDDPNLEEKYKFRMRLGAANMNDLTVGLRSGSRQPRTMERNILKFAKHPKYGQGGAYYDVAVAEADRIIEFTEYVRPVCLPMTPVDDEDALADDLVTLAGWGLQFSGDGKQLAKSLKLATLQVNPKSGCEDIFSKQNLKAIGLGRRGIRGIQRQLRNGFTNEIICVGNEWLADQTSCEGDSGSPVIRRKSG